MKKVNFMTFIHSFRLFLLCLFKSTATQKRSQRNTDTVSEFHALLLQVTASEGFAQGPYVVARIRDDPSDELRRIYQ